MSEPVPTPQPIGPGTRLGPYEILSFLGAGGMGKVYRARDSRLGRTVAVKVLPLGRSTDSDRLERFEREARAASALNHPNIVTIHDIGEAESGPYLAMELIEGHTLRQLLGSEPLPLKKVLQIAAQVADGLAKAHEAGIVHRDLKPENLMVSHDGFVKILDFGLAKLVPQLSEALSEAETIGTMTKSGTLLGTVAYMSPEQASGRPADFRSDQFSLGLILYEMTTARHAFERPTHAETLAAIIREEPDPIVSKNPQLPTPLRWIVERCLAKDPEERYASTRDLARDLASLRERLSELSGSTIPSPVAPIWAGRVRLAWSLAAVSCLAVAAVLAWNAWSAARTQAAPRLSRALRLTNTSAQEFGPAISPDNKWVAYFSNARGPSDVWVKFLDSGSTLNLTASLPLSIQVRAALGGVEISPDGGAISFPASQIAPAATSNPNPSAPQFDTWTIPAPLGGVPRKLLERLQGMRWSPDGKQLVCINAGSTRGDTLIVANSDGTNQRTILAPKGGRHIHWAAWSRDGKYLYFIQTYFTWHSEPSEIYRVAATGGEPEPVVHTSRRAIYPAPMPDGSLVFSANPNGLELGLWWRPRRGAAQPLTTGVGEYTESQVSADGRRLVSTFLEMRRYLAVVPVRFDAAVEMRQITDGYGGDLDPAFSPRGDRIAFSSSRSGNRNLWIARPDGSQPIPLTTESAIDEHPAFSPDGQQIAFASDRGGRHGIWVMSADGGAPRFLAPAVVLDILSWSPDGKRILYATAGGELPQLAMISVLDGKIEPFTMPRGGFSPAWSPQGDRIAYIEADRRQFKPSDPPPPARTLAFVDSRGRPLYPNLAEVLVLANGFLAWAPDGRRLAGLSIQANANASIWIIEPDAPVPFKKLLELPPTVRPRGVTWTPDGSALIIAKQETTSDIVLFDLTR